jgi:DNA-binding MarR family transcriptional regulator
MTDEDGRLDRAGNLLGALALAIADRTQDAIGGAAEQSTTAAIALSALDQFLDDPPVDLLRQVLGLTASGTVRLVDRLQEAGYVKRGPGHDARSVAVRLTPSGRRAARRVTAARGDVLGSAMAGLTAGEREAFERTVSKLLVGLMRGPGAVRWMCRVCDLTACGRSEGRCPVAEAARERYAASSA